MLPCLRYSKCSEELAPISLYSVLLPHLTLPNVAGSTVLAHSNICWIVSQLYYTAYLVLEYLGS